MEKYLLTIWVTVEQERIIKDIFTQHGWLFAKHEKLPTAPSRVDLPSIRKSPDTQAITSVSGSQSNTQQILSDVGSVPSSRSYDIIGKGRDVKNQDCKSKSDLKNNSGRNVKQTIRPRKTRLRINNDKSNQRSKDKLNFLEDQQQLLPNVDLQTSEKQETKTDVDSTVESSNLSDQIGTLSCISEDEEDNESLSGSRSSENKSETSKTSNLVVNTDVTLSSGCTNSVSVADAKMPNKSSSSDCVEKDGTKTEQNSKSIKFALARKKRSFKDSISKRKRRKEKQTEEIKCLMETIIKEGKVDIDMDCEKGKSVCPYCSKEFCNKVFFLKHVQRHTKNAFDCPDCGKTFNSGRSLQSHRYNRSASKIFQCDICDFAGNTACLLRWHRKHQHQPEKEFQCHLCAKVIKTKSYFNVHMKSVHNINERKYSYECHICGHKSMRRKSFERHMQGHQEEEGNYKCRDCGKVFKTKRLLSCHMRYHRDRKFLCDNCGKGFTTKTKLCSHYRTHTGDKPFECVLCDYKTAQNGNLRQHMKIHSKKLGTEDSVIHKDQREIGNYDGNNDAALSAMTENPDVCHMQTDPAYSSLPPPADSSGSYGSGTNVHMSLAGQSDAMVNVVYSNMAANDSSKQYPMGNHIPQAASNNNSVMQQELVNKSDTISYPLNDGCVPNMDMSMAEGLMHYPQHDGTSGYHGNHVDDPSLQCQGQQSQMVPPVYTEQTANGNMYPNVPMQYNSGVNNMESVYAQHTGHDQQQLQGDYSTQMPGSDYGSCKSSLYSTSLNALDYNEAYQSLYNTSQADFSKPHNLPHVSHSSETGFSNQTGSAMSVNQPKMVPLEYCKPVYQSNLMQDMAVNEHAQGYSMDDGLVYSQYDHTDSNMMASMGQTCMNFQHSANSGSHYNTLDTGNVMGVRAMYGDKGVAHDPVENSEHFADKQKLNSVYETTMNVL